MAQIAIDIPDAQLNRVVDAFATAYGYQVNIPDPANPGSTIPNPQNKRQFAKAQVARYVKEVVKGVEAESAAKMACAAAIADAETGVTPTHDDQTVSRTARHCN